MPIGFPGGGNFSRSGTSGLGNLLGYGGGPPEVDNDQINALLQHFGGLGVQPDYKPQGLFENMPWLSKRSPALAGGLDNALIALSNMGPTGSTAGENISNVARGVSSIGPTRRMQQMAPTMMALQMAGEVAKLQQASANIGREGAMAQYYGGRNAATEYAANQRLSGVQARAQMSAATSQHGPQIIQDAKGNPVVGVPDIDDEGHLIYQPHPEIDVKEFQKQQNSKKLNAMLGGGVEGSIIQGMLGDDPSAYKGGPQAYWNKANDILLQHRKAAAGVSAGGAADRQGSSQWFTSNQTQIKDVLSGPGTAAIREKRTDTRAGQIFQQAGGKLSLDAATSQAQQEEQNHKGRIQQAISEYSQMDEDTQRKSGGFMGYLQQQGYDPTTDSFRAPRTGAPAPKVSVMGAPQSNQVQAPNPGNSPAVQAIINSLQK
jgi:hypothetical protein